MTVLPAHMTEKQHDTHCWLLKSGHRWQIRRLTRDGFVFLRRPNPLGLPHYMTLDAHRIDWERYCTRASELLRLHDSMST